MDPAGKQGASNRAASSTQVKTNSKTGKLGGDESSPFSSGNKSGLGADFNDGPVVHYGIRW